MKALLIVTLCILAAIAVGVACGGIN